MKEEKINLRKDDGALRIMEALSAVDQELLERSGMPAAEAVEGKRSSMPVVEVSERKRNGRKMTNMSSNKKGYGKLWRYGRMAAACLAIVAVGAVSWGGLRLTRMNWEGSDSTSSGFSGGAQPGGTATNQEAAQEMTAGDNMYTDMDVTNDGNNIAEAPSSEAYIGGDNGGSNGADSWTESNPAATEEGILCTTPCPPDDRKTITEEQAMNSELGAYFPRLLPAGYSLESVRTDDQGQLYLCWTLGMDTIHLSITYVAAGELETVDISRPETYDVRLYELPYGETVPREFWEIFNNPIFLAEDFSLEAVASRMKSYRDAGDTDTPTGRFSVLYPDGILVGFDGDGSAEDIWAMFASLPE